MVEMAGNNLCQLSRDSVTVITTAPGHSGEMALGDGAGQ